MRYSVTGSTHLSEAGKFVIRRALEGLKDVDEFTTGGALGVDSEAAMIAAKLHPDAHHRIVTPNAPYNTLLLDLGFNIERMTTGGYMERNDRLVDHADVLLAFPAAAYEQLRSGTWATIRRARKRAIPVRIFPLDAR